MTLNPENIDPVQQASEKGFSDVINQLISRVDKEDKELIVRGLSALAEKDGNVRAQKFAEIANDLAEKNPQEIDTMFQELEKEILDGSNPQFERLKHMMEQMSPDQLQSLRITKEDDPEVFAFLEALSPKVREGLLKQVNTRILKHSNLQIVQTKEGFHFVRLGESIDLKPGEIEVDQELPSELQTGLLSLLSEIEIDKDTLQVKKKSGSDAALASMWKILESLPAPTRRAHMRSLNSAIREKFPFIPKDYNVLLLNEDALGLKEGASLSDTIAGTQIDSNVLEAPEGASDQIKALYQVLNMLLNVLRDRGLIQGDPVSTLQQQLQGLQTDRGQLQAKLQSAVPQLRNGLEQDLQHVDQEIVIVNGQIQEINNQRDGQMRTFGSQIHTIDGLQNARVLRDGSFITIVDSQSNMDQCVSHIRGRGYQFRRTSPGSVRIALQSRDIPSVQRLFGKDVYKNGITHGSLSIEGHMHEKYTEKERTHGWLENQRGALVQRRDIAEDAAVLQYKSMTGQPYSHCKKQVARHIEDQKYAPQKMLPTGSISPYSQEQYDRAYQIRLAAQGNLDRFDSLQKRNEVS